MPILLTLVWLVLLASSTNFRNQYFAFAPKLRSAWVVTVMVVVGATVVGCGLAALMAPSYTIPVGIAGLVGLVYFSDLVWCSGPAFWGMSKVLEGRGKTLAIATAIFFSLLGGGLIFFALRNMDGFRGPWSLQDTLMRAGALVSIVIVDVSVLVLVIPIALDLLERYSFPSFVGARHMRAKKSGFLTVISTLSILGVALGSCSVSSAVSVMGGFREDLKRKILGNNAHIVIDMESKAPIANQADVLARLKGNPKVLAITPVVHGECMVSSSSNLAGVIVRGVDTQTIRSVIDLGNNIEVGKFEYLTSPERLIALPPGEVIGLDNRGNPIAKGSTEFTILDDGSISDGLRATPPKPIRPGLIIGRELAKTIHAYVGDEVTLASPLGDLGPMGLLPRTKKFRVAAIFYSGMYEYDATHVYTTLPLAQEYFQLGEGVSVIDVRVKNAEEVEAITDSVRSALAGSPVRIRDWREINKNLFSALLLERYATMIVLSFIILVASFCIICTLLLMVTEKGKEIAILKAIGASDRDILKTFVIEGGIIGAIGTLFGITSALSLCLGIEKLGIRMDPEVYYIEKLPVHVSGSDFVIIAVLSFTICTLITIIPAWFASALRPVEGLRHE
jgi:lipoprotein-releasing system permease protein